MERVAIIGDATTVAGFRPLGFAVMPVERPSDARALWPRVLTDEFSVVFVTEEVFSAVEDLAAELADRALPALTVIPGVGGQGGMAEAKLSRAIERALGTKMPVREEDE